MMKMKNRKAKMKMKITTMTTYRIVDFQMQVTMNDDTVLNMMNKTITNDKMKLILWKETHLLKNLRIEMNY